MTLSDGRELWLVTGSQHLYGVDTIDAVSGHAQKIAAALSDRLSMQLVAQTVVTTPDAIRDLCLAANADERCIGVVAWMHTFSPAKMWIAGLQVLQKPLAQLHTQFNRDLPWSEIDMDFMNLNQSAHGDREFGYIASRMGIRRPIVVGHWQDPRVAARLDCWLRAAAALHEARRLRVARFGDNMREVAVTEGDKVEAQIRLGVSVNTYGVTQLVEAVEQADNAAVDRVVAEYLGAYHVAPELSADGSRHESLRDAARIEVGLRSILDAGAQRAFTDTFEDLGSLRQLPGIAAQRLMADGYGFGAEGDWKSAVLVRLLKVMSEGLTGGTSFMEDYTYHLGEDGATVLGAHMLEVCPSISNGTPTCEIHPLSIGGREDPVRLVFTAAPGPAVVVGLADMGDRFRLVANEIEIVSPPHPMPRLPVARALWRPLPDLPTAAEGWMLAGGPHHTVLTSALTLDHLTDFAELVGIELLAIDRNTTVRGVKNELRWNDAAYRFDGRG